jgi:hypothetical protein
MVRPGSTGGHVALVGRVDDKTIEMIGGNQGGVRPGMKRYGSEYEFRRGTPTERMDGAINNAATGGVKAEGNVNLTVNSNGTAAKTEANADGLWQKTTIQNFKQMRPTSSPEVSGAGASGAW